VLLRAVTPPGGAWHLTVPTGTRHDVLSALARPSTPRPAGKVGRSATRRAALHADAVHVVRPRETVSSIAKQYGVTVKDVLRWNRLEYQARIRPGDRIRIADVRPSVDRDGQGGFR
jgi:nucleoid-associated protein YgaU